MGNWKRGGSRNCLQENLIHCESDGRGRCEERDDKGKEDRTGQDRVEDENARRGLDWGG